MNYRKSRVTIHATVFVPEYEIANEMGLAHTDDQTPSELLSLENHDLIKAAFHKLATEKVSKHFQTDEPMKLHDQSIELDTFQ